MKNTYRTVNSRRENPFKASNQNMLRGVGSNWSKPGKLSYLLGLTMLLTPNLMVHAQFVAPVTADEITGCSASQVENTGTSAIGDLQVIVWDGNEPGISFIDHSTSPATVHCFSLTGHSDGMIVKDPDVVWDYGSADLVVVVYEEHQGSNVEVWSQMWRWNSGSPTLETAYGSSGYLRLGQSSTTYPNVDADFNGNAVAVWEKGSSVYAKAIEFNTLTASTHLYWVDNTSCMPNGKQPDVAVRNQADQTFVSFVFADISNTDIIVSHEIISTVKTGTSTCNFTTLAKPTGVIIDYVGAPRIAKPNWEISASMWYDGWDAAVVYEGRNTTDYFIVTSNRLTHWSGWIQYDPTPFIPPYSWYCGAHTYSSPAYISTTGTEWISDILNVSGINLAHPFSISQINAPFVDLYTDRSLRPVVTQAGDFITYNAWNWNDNSSQYSGYNEILMMRLMMGLDGITSPLITFPNLDDFYAEYIIPIPTTQDYYLVSDATVSNQQNNIVSIAGTTGHAYFAFVHVGSGSDNIVFKRTAQSPNSAVRKAPRFAHVIEEKEKSILYPNPTQGELWINCPEKIGLLKISSLEGKLLLKHANLDMQSELNLADLALNPGLFLVEITDVTGKTTHHKVLYQPWKYIALYLLIWLFPSGANAQGEAANWVLYGGKIQFWPSNSWVPYGSPPRININEKLSLSSCDGRLIWHIGVLQNQSGHYGLFDSLNVALINLPIYSSTRILSAKANDTSWLIVNTGPNPVSGLTRTPQLYKLSSVSGINYNQIAHLDGFNIEGFNIAKRDSLFGYWMVYYSQTSNRMVSMPFDEFGFYPANNVYSDTITRPFLFTHANRIEFSSSGELLAMADYNSNILHLWRFNKTTGVLSNHLELNVASLVGLSLFQLRLLTLCFSQNGTKIYVKASDFSTNGANGFYQFDIQSWDTTQILNSIQYIGQAGRIYTWPTLALDGNIYYNSFSDVYGDTLSYGRLENTDSTFQNSNLIDRLYDFNVGSLASSAAGFLNRLPSTPSFLLNPNRYSIVAQNQCLGDSTRLSLYDYQNLDTVVWDLGDGSPRTNSFTPVHRYAAPGLYVVTAFTRYCNRPDTLYYQLEILGEPELPFADTSICRGDSLRLQLPANWAYQWSTGDSTAAVSFGAAGIYSVTINNGCFTATDSFELRLVDPATATLPADTGFCMGDSVWVDPGPLAGTVAWSDGGNGARWISQAGNYTLSMTNACGTENHALSIGVYGAPPLALNDTSICEGRVLRIELPEYWETSYLWQDGISDRIRSLSDSGLYIVNANNPCGSSTDSLQFALRDCNCTLYLPNAFSPNGDGINDQFTIISRCALREYELLIYDRWGKNIFRSTSPTQGWDGRFNGEMMPVGAYAFVVNYMPEGSGRKTDKGVIRLVR